MRFVTKTQGAFLLPLDIAIWVILWYPCRKHLLSHLEGNIAWLHPEDAIKQRERLKAERIAAREQRVEPVRDVQTINDNVPNEISEPTVSECEEVLEYEDYEQEETFEMNGKSYEGMAYLMNRGTISPPSQQYYNTILQGYRENEMDEAYLQTALENSIHHEQFMDEEFDEDFDLDDDLQMKF